MNPLVSIAQFLVDEILSVPAFLVGIITAVGLIALRRPASAVLGSAIKAIPASGNRVQADRLHATALLVAKITNEYAFIAADTSGGMAVSAGVGDQVAIDKLTLEVDRQIAAQLKEFSQRSDVYAPLRSVSSKWNFVRRNLLDVSRASVPFVVDRYAVQINDSYRLAISALGN